MINEEQSPDESFNKALPPEKTLPEGTENLGQLDVLKLALQEGTRSLKTEGRIRNFASFESGLLEKGIDMKKMPGSVSEGIMDFVSRRTRDPNESLQDFNNLIDMVQKKQKEDVTTSRGMLVNMMNTPGMLSTMEDEDINSWAERTGLDTEYINKFRNIDITNTKSADYYAEQIGLGNMLLKNVPEEIRELTFSKVDWAEIDGETSNASIYDKLAMLQDTYPEASDSKLRIIAKEKYGDEIKGISNEDLDNAILGEITDEDLVGEMIDGPIAEFEQAHTSADKQVSVYITNSEGSQVEEIIKSREDLINILSRYYPEVDKQKIVDSVYGNTTNKKNWVGQ